MMAVFNWIVQLPTLAKFWPGILLLPNGLASFFLHTNQCDSDLHCVPGQVLVRKCAGRDYLLGNLPQHLQTLKPPHINMQEIRNLVLELFFSNQKLYQHTNWSSLWNKFFPFCYKLSHGEEHEFFALYACICRTVLIVFWDVTSYILVDMRLTSCFGRYVPIFRRKLLPAYWG
jgi:hypothetical protein